MAKTRYEPVVLTKLEIIQMLFNALSVGCALGGSLGLQFEPYQIVLLVFAGLFQVCAQFIARRCKVNSEVFKASPLQQTKEVL